jgi:hypothetical protein
MDELKFKSMTVSEIQNLRNECTAKIEENLKEFQDKTGIGIIALKLLNGRYEYHPVIEMALEQIL